MTRALVYGLAVAGASTARALLRRGIAVTVVDDVVTTERTAIADEIGVGLIDGGKLDDAAIEALLADCDMLCPAPGLAETHRVIVAAERVGIDVLSEIELAYRWEQDRPGGPRPMLAVTGTDGKTSTSKMAVAMLAAAGVRSVDAGNTDMPLVDAIDDDDYDAFVVECSSFRLAFTTTFRAEAAAWLNLQPDHLNWHRSMDTYAEAKNRIWAHQRPTDVAIGFGGDPAVLSRLTNAIGRSVTFGVGDGAGEVRSDYFSDGVSLVGPHGVIAAIAAMRRHLPHDISNALAAAALVLETGLATAADVANALAGFVGPPHRLELVGHLDGVDWFNDSKATTPHAASAAVRSFDRIVLIAGGADKGVDLSSMAADSHRVVGVVAIGSTAGDIADLFAHVGRVQVAETLERAVPLAHEWALPGDTVLLSPGCASLDQFTNFEQRGDVFRQLVNDLSPVANSAGGAA